MEITSHPSLQRVVRILGLTVLLVLNVSAALAAAVFASEVYLAGQASDTQAEDHAKSAEADELVKRGYYPAGVQVDPYKQFEVLDRNPVYGWYWTTNEDGVLPRHTPVVSIDAHGFRGAGVSPKNPDARKRPLAFLIGGSSAFGFRASSDQTTITAYLNRLQDDFQFVNAAVTGWDSSQELTRLRLQLIGFAPKLVVSYTLGNDLERVIEGLEDSGGWFQRLAFRLAPHTSDLAFSFLYRHLQILGNWLSQGPSPAAFEAAVDAQVDAFVGNQESMYNLCKKNGIRFVTVIQAMTMTHDKVTIKGARPDLYRRGVKRALASDYCKANCLNFSAVFDPLFDTVPVFFRDYATPALGASADPSSVVFADQWHLLDAGNAIVAQQLVADLGLLAASPQH